MADSRRGMTKLIIWLDVLATALLLFILAGLWLYRERIFTIGSPLGVVELLMLVGFGSILLFNGMSIAWLWQFLHEKTALLMVLGMLCLVLMAAEKVMVDEVAHQTELAWSMQTEYLILYGMLIVQLVYNLLVLRRTLRTSNVAIQ